MFDQRNKNSIKPFHNDLEKFSLRILIWSDKLKIFIIDSNFPNSSVKSCLEFLSPHSNFF